MNNEVLPVKTGVLIFQILFYAGLLILLKTLINDIRSAAVGVFFAGFSTLHLYFLSEFLNNLAALTFFIWSAFGLVKTIQTKRFQWLAFSVVMLSGAILCHRSAFGLFFAISIVFPAARFCVNYANDILSRTALILSLICLIAGSSFLSFFAGLPDWLMSELSPSPQNPFRSLVLMENCILLTTVFTTFIIWFAKPEILRKNSAGKILLANAFWSLLITLNPFLFHQTGINGIITRLDILVFLQLGLTQLELTE